MRQNTVNFLIDELSVPKSHINLEKEFIINKLKKRFDIVVYNSVGKCSILIECKSFDVKLNEKAIDQILIYNQYLRSNFLMLTNGINHLFLKKSFDKIEKINSLPNYTNL